SSITNIGNLLAMPVRWKSPPLMILSNQTLIRKVAFEVRIYPPSFIYSSAHHIALSTVAKLSVILNRCNVHVL
ncbi:MAG: hypothetical protein WCT46_05750, partial [Candidatus Gracilibacteria bacterium]